MGREKGQSTFAGATTPTPQTRDADVRVWVEETPVVIGHQKGGHSEGCSQCDDWCGGGGHITWNRCRAFEPHPLPKAERLE